MARNTPKKDAKRGKERSGEELGGTRSDDLRSAAGSESEPASTRIASPMSLEDVSPESDGVHEITASSSRPLRLRMARRIFEFEARRDPGGRIRVYWLPPGDGGGRYEVAGINERYHKEAADQLVALIEAGRHEEAESYATEYIAKYTDVAGDWCRTAAIEFYLRDCVFNRGPGGAAWIVQRAVGVEIDRAVGPITRAAIASAENNPVQLLNDLRSSREVYERGSRDESSSFWNGLVNRWNNAREFALSLLEESGQ